MVSVSRYRSLGVAVQLIGPQFDMGSLGYYEKNDCINENQQYK